MDKKKFVKDKCLYGKEDRYKIGTEWKCKSEHVIGIEDSIKKLSRRGHKNKQERKK